ncbi:MAG: hypothetical protein NT118_03765 [Lentisphaerae bacterium]|nr:hypothetical protein [Lentisphaerota bacterium]
MKNPFPSISCILLLLSFSVTAADEPASSVRYKLETLKIENIELKDTRLSDAIALIKALCKKADPEGKGVNISFMAPKDDKGKTMDPAIDDISLTDVPLKDVLRYVCDATGMSYRTEKFSIMVFPKTMVGDNMETRTFKIRPDAVDSIERK